MEKKLKVRAVAVQKQTLKIKTEYIKLDSALKFCNLVSTGGEAKIMIEQGLVRVNGEKCFERGKKLRRGDSFEYGRDSFLIETEE